jgi:hypothetical protein
VGPPAGRRGDRTGAGARAAALREAGQPRLERGHLEGEDADELAPAIDDALSFDRKVIIEAGVPDPREIECAVLGNDDPRGLGGG